jgi:dephospho-CoA kinase
VSNRTHIPVVGIVGGIGSGKSSVAKWVAKRHSDLILINGDETGHEVLTRPSVKDAIRKRFGEAVFDVDGHVDRKSLGQIVFGSKNDQRLARRDLEQIVHPQIRKIFEERIAEAAASGKSVVLLDAAVLFEAGWNDLCHTIVFVDVPDNHRLDRLRETRGWDEAEVRSREASQAPLETKRKNAQSIIENVESLEEAGQKLESLVTRIRDTSTRDLNDITA